MHLCVPRGHAHFRDRSLLFTAYCTFTYNPAPAYLIYSIFINYCCNQKTGYGYRILP